MFYAVVAVPLAIWAWRHHTRLRSGALAATPSQSAPSKSSIIWVALATIGMAGLVVFYFFDMNWHVRSISSAEAQKLIEAHPDARFSISQYQSGARLLWIVVRENGKQTKFTAPVDNTTTAALTKSGISCRTYVQGRDFEILGWPGRFLFLVAIFAFAAGIVVLTRAALRRRAALGPG
jgi:hypothetical protein